MAFQKYPPTEESARFRKEIIEDIKFTTIILHIAKCFLESEKTEDSLSKILRDAYEEVPKNLLNLDKLVITLGETDVENGIVYIPFERNGKRGIAAICEKDKGTTYRLLDPRWEIMDRYAVFIERDKQTEKRKKMKEKLSLWDQAHKPNAYENPKEYVIYEISRLVLSNNTREAINVFFTSASFQKLKSNMDFTVDIFNRLIDAYGKAYMEDEEKAEAIVGATKKFADNMIKNMVELSEESSAPGEIVHSAQLIAKQAETIISWIRREIGEAEDMSLTIDEEDMVSNEKRGKGFINAGTLPSDMEEVKDEGAAGFYWRGIEKVKKLGKNILEVLKFDKERFNNVKDKLVMYLMDHGFVKVPDGLKTATEDGFISTIHETYFMSDLLPGSYQTTSTGPGHFQGNKLDIKHVTEGEVVQVNVKDNEEAEGPEIICQIVKAGQICCARPGYRDYMINLGGGRFNDFSVALTPELAKLFDKNYDEDKFAEIEKAFEANKEEINCPYLGALFGDEAVLVKTGDTEGNTAWIESSLNVGEDSSLVRRYQSFSSMEDVYGLVKELAESYRTIEKPITVMSIEEAERKVKASSEKADKPASLGKTEGINTFIDSNVDFLSGVLGLKTNTPKLIRMPIELIGSAGVEEIKGFLEAIQNANSNGYIELFSTEENSLEISADRYESFGIKKRNLPRGFEGNRENTITVFPVEKGEELPDSKINVRWKKLGYGMESPEDTIVSPVGFNLLATV